MIEHSVLLFAYVLYSVCVNGVLIKKDSSAFTYEQIELGRIWER